MKNEELAFPLDFYRLEPKERKILEHLAENLEDENISCLYGEHATMSILVDSSRSHKNVNPLVKVKIDKDSTEGEVEELKKFFDNFGYSVTNETTKLKYNILHFKF